MTDRRLVLDTNVVLDAWWFGDPRAERLVAAIERGDCTWLATPDMRDELRDVLDRPAFSIDGGAGRRTLAAFDRWAQAHCLHPLAAPLNCADPDDQIFLDLAYGACARWLVTRDRALLTIARQARAWPCHIVTPEAWPGDG